MKMARIRGVTIVSQFVIVSFSERSTGLAFRLPAEIAADRWRFPAATEMHILQHLICSELRIITINSHHISHLANEIFVFCCTFLFYYTCTLGVGQRAARQPRLMTYQLETDICTHQTQSLESAKLWQKNEPVRFQFGPTLFWLISNIVVFFPSIHFH